MNNNQIEKILEDFHKEELKKRPEWCKKYMNKECKLCNSVWCCLWKKFNELNEDEQNG